MPSWHVLSKSWLCSLCSALWLAGGSSAAPAAEGGYSNYVPGTYGDFGVAIAPEPGFSLRNDVYYYSAEQSRAVLQGQARAELDIAFTIDLLTGFYVTDAEVLGGKFGFGAQLQLTHADIEAQATAAGRHYDEEILKRRRRPSLPRGTRKL